MRKEYYKVTLDLSVGSAYKYTNDSEIPAKIKYGRIHNGKFEKGKIEGKFTNTKLHDVLFLIKSGCELSVAEECINLVD